MKKMIKLSHCDCLAFVFADPTPVWGNNNNNNGSSGGGHTDNRSSSPETLPSDM